MGEAGGGQSIPPPPASPSLLLTASPDSEQAPLRESRGRDDAPATLCPAHTHRRACGSFGRLPVCGRVPRDANRVTFWKTSRLPDPLVSRIPPSAMAFRTLTLFQVEGHVSFVVDRP